MSTKKDWGDVTECWHWSPGQTKIPPPHTHTLFSNPGSSDIQRMHPQIGLRGSTILRQAQRVCTEKVRSKFKQCYKTLLAVTFIQVSHNISQDKGKGRWESGSTCDSAQTSLSCYWYVALSKTNMSTWQFPLSSRQQREGEHAGSKQAAVDYYEQDLVSWYLNVIIITEHKGFTPHSVKQKHQVRLGLSSSLFISNFLTLKSHRALRCKSRAVWEAVCFPWKDGGRYKKIRRKFETAAGAKQEQLFSHVTFQNYTLTTGSKYGPRKCVYCWCIFPIMYNQLLILVCSCPLSVCY